MIIELLTWLTISSQLMFVAPLWESRYYRKGGLQSHCGNSGSYTNRSEIKNVSTENGDGITMKVRNKTFFERTLQYFFNIKGSFINERKDYTKPSPKDNKDGIQFDLRKREDTYTKTDPRDHPYCVFLQIEMESSADMIYRCSGSLLTAEWVLTAAHCLQDDPGDKIASVMVYMGGNSDAEMKDILNNVTQLAPTAQLIESEQIIPHPGFKKHPNAFDIGLVKVSRPFKMTDTVTTIKLFNKPWLHRGYKTCITTGFGVVRDNSDSEDDGHRKTHSLLVKQPCVCNFMMNFIFDIDRDNAVNRIMCSMPREDHGICSGDSGSGLVCEDEGEIKIRAITMMTMEFDDVDNCEINVIDHFIGSETGECGEKNLVNMFQDIYPHLPWLNKYIKLFSEDEMSEVERTIAAASCIRTSIWANVMGICLVKLFLCKFLSHDYKLL